MRLPIVSNGHSIGRKLILGIIRLMMGHKAPDVVRTLFYRPKFFGDPHSAWTNQVMRGPSDWPVAEREVFAAFTSRLNQCVF
jgi:hypothetical protein